MDLCAIMSIICTTCLVSPFPGSHYRLPSSSCHSVSPYSQACCSCKGLIQIQLDSITRRLQCIRIVDSYDDDHLPELFRMANLPSHQWRENDIRTSLDPPIHHRVLAFLVLTFQSLGFNSDEINAKRKRLSFDASTPPWRVHASVHVLIALKTHC
jgi:hypothetical protein